MSELTFLGFCLSIDNQRNGLETQAKVLMLIRVDIRDTA